LKRTKRLHCHKNNHSDGDIFLSKCPHDSSGGYDNRNKVSAMESQRTKRNSSDMRAVTKFANYDCRSLVVDWKKANGRAQLFVQSVFIVRQVTTPKSRVLYSLVDRVFMTSCHKISISEAFPEEEEDIGSSGFV